MPKDRIVLVDSHAHIDTSRFARDREEVIQAAVAGGVTRMVDPGCDLASSRDALALAKAHPGTIFAGVGVHPHEATTYTDEIGEQLRTLAREPEVVAIGEFGLDHFRMLSPRNVQREVFCAHLDLARKCNLPCIIHVRDAHDDVMELLRAHGRDLHMVAIYVGSFTVSLETLLRPESVSPLRVLCSPLPGHSPSRVMLYLKLPAWSRWIVS